MRKEYEDKFLFGLNSVNSDARDLWKSGGQKYRNDIFLEYLRGNRTFSFNGNSTTNFCEYLATAIQAKKIAQDNAIQDAPEDEKNNYKVATEELYNILIQQVEGTHSFTGVYPTIIQQTIDDAREMQKDWWRVKSYWEPMVYDDTMFPAFDNNQHDIVGKALSFNEHLFCAIYQGLKLSLMSPTDMTPEATVGELKVYRYTWNEKVSSSTLASDLETFLKTVYKAIYDEGTPIDAYNTAKEYKMPCLSYPEGGEIYRAYKARWEANAAKIASEKAC